MSVENLLSHDRTESAGGRRLTARIVQLLSNPAVAIVVLIVATALNRYRIDIASLGFRIEHFALILVGAIYFVKLIRRQWHPLLARDDVPLVLYLAIALIASLMNAPVPKESLQFFGLMAACVLTYILTKSIVADAATFRTAVLALLVVGVGEAVAGVFIWLLYPLGVNLGVQLYPLVFNANRNAVLCTFSPIGTQVESNIFGSYVLPIGLMFTLLLLSAGLSSRRRLMVLALAALLIGLVLSLTRSVWVAFALGTLIVLLLADDRRPRSLMNLVPPFLVAVLVGIFASNVQLPCTYVVNEDRTVTAAPGAASAPVSAATLSRGTPTANPSPQIVPLTTTRITTTATFLERLGTYQGVVEDWLRHPWIGNGANVFGQRHITTAHTPSWISNATLMVLHDTGIIGLAIVCVWFVWIGRDVVRALRRGPPGFTRTALLALGIAFIGLLVVYQLTTALWLGFTWVYLGLIRAGTLILQRGQDEVQVCTKSRSALPRTIRSLGDKVKIVSWTDLSLGALLVFGTLLRLYQLGAKSLWTDEILQAGVARNGFIAAIQGAATHTAAPPLDYLFTALMFRFGNDEFAVRLPSAIWGICAIFAVYKLGSLLFRSREIGLVAAFLLTVAPMQVWYSQEARYYSLHPLLSIVCVYFFVRALYDPNLKNRGLLFLAFLFSFYTHYYTVFVVAALGLFILLVVANSKFRFFRDLPSRGFATILGYAGLGLLVLILFTPWLLVNNGGIRTGNFSFTMPAWSDLVTLVLFGPYRFNALADQTIGVVALWLFPLLAILGLGFGLYRRQAAILVLFLLVLVSAGGVLILDRVTSYFYAPRQLLFVLPFYLLLVAAGLVFLSRALFFQRRFLSRLSLAVVLTGLGVLALSSVYPYYNQPKDDWRDVSLFLMSASANSKAPIVAETDDLSGYLLYYQPELAKYMISGSDLQSPEKRQELRHLWLISLSPQSNLSQKLTKQGGWHSIELGASPGLHLYYLGSDSEDVLWAQVPKYDLLPQMLVYSPALANLQKIDPALATGIAEKSLASMRGGNPPMLNGQKAALLLNIGEFYLGLGRVDLAINDLNEALGYDPFSIEILNNLGMIYANTQQCDKAIGVLTGSTRLYPESYFAHSFLGQSLACESRWSESADQYQRAIEINPGAADLMQLAKMRIRSGENQEAASALREILSNFADAPEAAQAQSLLPSLNK